MRVRIVRLHCTILGMPFRPVLMAKLFYSKRKMSRRSKVLIDSKRSLKNKIRTKNRNQRMTNYSSVNPLTYCWES